VRFSAASARIFEPKVDVDNSIRDDLKKRIDRLKDSAHILTSERPYPVLSNGDFEETAAGILGWEVFATPEGNGTAERIATAPASGKNSIRMLSGGGTVALTSSPFAAPATGGIYVLVHLRVSDPATRPTFRVLMFEEAGGGDFRAVAEIGGQESAVVLKQEWQPIKIAFEAPPGPHRRYRLRCELVGPGEIGMDDIQFFERPGSNTEHQKLLVMINKAEIDLKHGRFAECLDFLTGYWARYLESQSLPTSDRLAATAQKTPQPAPPAADEDPGMLGRIRGALPRFLRF
jgi:hypothetical protein